jgi:hypothetical protein
MNQLISYNEAAGVLKNPPTMMSQPNFTKIRALRKHIMQALKQLVCLQSLIYGWAGLAMNPTMYLLIKSQQFVTPPDPGASPPYPQFTTPQGIKTCERLWENEQNYYCCILTSAARAYEC